ncbi:MAG TPA: hypothetical protein VF883_16325 [Thermoanaerobaculia bacterium]|jgi:hypothetical protein
MPNALYDLLETVKDETSFLRFLTALRQDSETHARNCRNRSYQECVQDDHWETNSTKDFLKSMEDWGTRGDFADGEHFGEPMLRRIATMLYVGRNLLREDRP